MVLIWGLIIGAVAGAFAAWLYWRSQLQQQEMQLNRLQRALEERDRDHEARLRKTTESLQQDYQKQLQQQIAQLQQEHAVQLAAARAPASYIPDAALAPPVDQSAAARESRAEQPARPPETTASVDLPIAPPLEAATGEAATGVDVLPDHEPGEPAATEPPAEAPLPNIATLTLVGAVPAPLLEPLPPAEAIAPSFPLPRPALPLSSPQLLAIARSSSSAERAELATAMGAIAAQHPRRSDVLGSISVLDWLSRDPDASVRASAVAALGQIASDRVIPLLQRSLRDRDPEVVRVASQAIARYKTYAVKKPGTQPANATPRKP